MRLSDALQLLLLAAPVLYSCDTGAGGRAVQFFNRTLLTTGTMESAQASAKAVFRLFFFFLPETPEIPNLKS